MDAYDEFNKDYYSTIECLVSLKKEHPELRVAIKHHSSAGIDDIEDDLLNESGIIMLPNRDNSYLESVKSIACVTYGSTMGYELYSIGRPVLFLDPGCKNSLLEECGKDDLYGNYRVTSYSEFENRVLDMIKKGRSVQLDKAVADEYCMEPTGVSERISEVLCN
jgi:hypothetical protein